MIETKRMTKKLKQQFEIIKKIKLDLNTRSNTANSVI